MKTKVLINYYIKTLIELLLIINQFGLAEQVPAPCKHLWGEFNTKEVLDLLNSSLHYLKETIRLDNELEVVRDTKPLMETFRNDTRQIRERYSEVTDLVKEFNWKEASDTEYEAFITDIEKLQIELESITQELMLNDKKTVKNKLFAIKDSWKAQLPSYKVLKREHKENRLKLDKSGIKLWSQEEPFDGGKYDLNAASDGTQVSLEIVHSLYQSLHNLCEADGVQDDTEHIEEIRSQIQFRRTTEQDKEELEEFQNIIEAYQRSMSLMWKQFEDYEIEEFLYGLKLEDIDLGWSGHVLATALDELKRSREGLNSSNDVSKHLNNGKDEF